MKMEIFTDNQKYNMHTIEYKIIWDNEGERIKNSFLKVLHIPFKEKIIKLLINEGKDNSNYSGVSEDDTMNFRYNNRCKIGTFLHELSHRIVMEYSLFDIAKEMYKIDDIHKLIDLFLYDVIVQLYGKEAADLRVLYESNFEEKIYSESWNYALSFSYEERQRMLKEIVKDIKYEKE